MPDVYGRVDRACRGELPVGQQPTGAVEHRTVMGLTGVSTPPMTSSRSFVMLVTAVSRSHRWDGTHRTGERTRQ